MKGFIWNSTPDRVYPYGMIKLGGIDAVYVNYLSDKEWIKKDLDSAYQDGMKIILLNTSYFMIDTWRNGKFDDEYFKEVMSHPAVYAFHLGDEPRDEYYIYFKMYYQHLKTLTDKPLWLNLYPNIVSEEKTGKYDEYVQKFYECCDILSADFYPVMNNGIPFCRRNKWYRYLKTLWRLKDNSKPLWMYFCTTKHLSYPKLTLESLKVQTNASLMFGADDTICFCYSDRPVPSETEGVYSESALSVENKRQDAYFIIKRYHTAYENMKAYFNAHKAIKVGRTMLHINPFSKILFTSQPYLFWTKMDDGITAILNVSVDRSTVCIIREGFFKYKKVNILPGDICFI